MSWAGKKFSEVVASKNDAAGVLSKSKLQSKLQSKLRQMQPTDGGAQSKPKSSPAVPKGAATVANHDLRAFPTLAESKGPKVLKGPVNERSSEGGGKDAEKESWETVTRGKKKEPMANDESTVSPEAAVEIDSNATSKMTEEELEKIRQAKRDKRKREKEGKKKKKEEEKRLALMAPKTSKIKMISADVLQRMLRGETVDADQLAGKKRKKTKASAGEVSKEGTEGENVTPAKAGASRAEGTKSAKGIRFMDDEYPTLAAESTGSKPKAVVISRSASDAITGKELSDAESGSEWETDVEDVPEGTDQEKREIVADEEISEEAIVVIDGPSSSSYSSILKTTKQPEPEALDSHSPGADANAKTQENEAADPSAETAKKVKKKDPITFDLFAALNATKKEKKATAVATKKPAVVAAPVRNILDSGAPTKRRGKERERPRKKKKTPLKRQILETREKRRKERLEAKALTAVLNSLKPAENQEESNSEINKTENTDVTKELSDPINVVAETDYERVGNPEANGAVERESVSPPETLNVNAKPFVPQGPSDTQELVSHGVNVDTVPAFTEAKKVLHRKKFRDYCDHDLSKELDDVCKTLLQDVVRFQDRQYNKDPVKAKARRRYIVGLREVKKFLVVKKVRLVVIAPDLENVEGKGGLNECIEEIKRLAAEQDVPVFYVMNRWNIGKSILRKVPVSIVGVMNYDGTDANFKKMVELRLELKSEYDDKLARQVKLLQGSADGSVDVTDTIRSEFVNKIRVLSKKDQLQFDLC